MEELTLGLSFLPKKLETLTRQVDEVTMRLTELRRDLDKKACDTGLRELRQQVETVRMVQKESAMQEHLDLLAVKVKDLGSTVSKKAEERERRNDKMLQQLSAVTTMLEQKAPVTSVDKLSAEIQGLNQFVMTKMETTEVKMDGLGKMCELVKDTIGHGGTSTAETVRQASEISRMSSEVQDLVGTVAQKADLSVVDKLLEMHRQMKDSLNTTLAEKAEFTETQQLQAQLQGLTSTVAQKDKARLAELERLDAQIQKLQPIVENSAGTGKRLLDLIDFVQSLNSSKADNDKVNEIVAQLQMLCDMVTPILPKQRLVMSPRCRRPASAGPPRRPNKTLSATSAT